LIDYHGPRKDSFILQKGEQFAALNDYQILLPWGGLRGTPTDLAHFVQMHLNGGRYRDKQVLEAETVASMQVNQQSTDGSPLGFGLSWWVGNDNFGDYVYRTGNGAGSEGNMRIYPDLGIGVVVMSNVTGYQRDRIVAGLVSAWMNEK
jgi:CubicO group peptidase (beta-lactamase class C family)